MDRSTLYKKYSNALLEALLFVVLFFSYAYGEKHDPFHYADIIFFLVYVAATLLINLILLPAFFYKKRYLEFLIGVIVIMHGVILLEEFVLEQIFYPNSRGQYFGGFLGSWLEIMPFVLIPVGFKAMLDLRKKQSQMEQLQQLVQQSELQFLKNQINPHFLFNNLNNLYAIALEDSKQVPEIILKLSNVLRYMLYDCRTDAVILDKELKHLEDLVGLYELQIQERGRVYLNISFSNNSLVIAPLLLNVFVENAFKHSTSSLSTGLEVLMDISLEGNELTFKCENNFAAESNTSDLGTGIGLKNVKNRLNLLYPNRHQLTLKEENDRFIVELTLTLTHD